MEEEIQPILVPAILEHEGIGGIPGIEKPPRTSSSSANDDSMTHVDPREALDVMIKLLGRSVPGPELNVVKLFTVGNVDVGIFSKILNGSLKVTLKSFSASKAFQ